jgi:thiol-disulfide isomerase/thioredoxin
MMRSLILFFIGFTLISSCTSSKLTSGKDYITIPDDRAKILSGKIDRSILETDTAFAWFKENMQWGEADASAVAAFQKNATKFSLVVVFGTWCHDSYNLLPKFYRLLDKSSYPSSKVLLIAVDRNKKAYKNIQSNYNITNTPTFIVIQNGKEVGRVTEYGKTGYMEKELGEIISGL